MTGPDTIFGIKFATVASAAVAAALSIALEWEKYDWRTAIFTFVAGVFVAVVATQVTLEIFGIADNPGSWGYGVAAAYGISGRNLILWIKTHSSDPIQFVRDVFGVGKDGNGEGK